MRVALFVEGSAPVGNVDHCTKLWNATLLPALGRAPVDVIVPIGKDAISRMRGLRTSTSAPGLDARIAQTRRLHNLDPATDAIVIAWDLEPVDPDHRRCAFDEKLGLYKGIAESALLADTSWALDAAARAAVLALRAGTTPAGASLSRLQPGTVLALCMEPMFEGLLVHDGRAVRDALGLSAYPSGWPSGWGGAERDPSKRLMAPAIDLMRAQRPRAPVRRLIRDNWRNAKDEWGDDAKPPENGFKAQPFWQGATCPTPNPCPLRPPAGSPSHDPAERPPTRRRRRGVPCCRSPRRSSRCARRPPWMSRRPCCLTAAGTRSARCTPPRPRKTERERPILRPLSLPGLPQSAIRQMN